MAKGIEFVERGLCAAHLSCASHEGLATAGDLDGRSEPLLSASGVIRRLTANQAAVPINSSTCGQIAACLPAAPGR